MKGFSKVASALMRGRRMGHTSIAGNLDNQQKPAIQKPKGNGMALKNKSSSNCKQNHHYACTSLTCACECHK